MNRYLPTDKLFSVEKNVLRKGYITEPEELEEITRMTKDQVQKI
jgi:hypothetical protein